MTFGNNDLSDDILVAFADGELPADELERLRPIINADPAASRKVAAYRESGEALRNFFSVDVPAQTPKHIVDQISGLSAETNSPNIVSFLSYRGRLSHRLQAIARGRTLKNIAASLLVGAFLGVGGTSLFGPYYSPQNPLKEEIIYRSGERKNGNTTPEHVSFALDFSGRIINPGEVIPREKPFKIIVNVKTRKTISIIYHEPKNPPETLVRNKTLDRNTKFYFPISKRDGLSINTQPKFVTFEVLLNDKNGSKKNFYSYGIE